MTHSLLCCSGSLDGGGSERQLWQLVNGIDRAKCRPSVYLLYRQGRYLRELAEDVPVFDFWSHYDSDRFLIGQAHREQIRHLEVTIAREEIEIVYDRTFHMTLITAAACRRSGVPRVSAIVSPPSQDFARSRERFHFLKKRILRKAYRDPNSLVLTVSDAVADDAAEYYGLDRDNLRVVASPVDTSLVRKLAMEPLDSDSGIDPDSSTMNICVVGRLSEEKGQRDAIQAFAEFVNSNEPELQGSGAALHIVGDGPMRSNLQALVDELGLAADVHFHGFVENPYPIMQGCDLLLLPSHYEGLPNVVLEAMALETSLLVTRCSSTLESILDQAGLAEHEAQLVPAGDVSRMAEGLQLVQRRLREAGRVPALSARKYVESHHGMPNWLAQMEAIFAEQLARAPTLPRRKQR
ncbi:MAG: glycosyltransferase [Planctomycetota bacterium]